MQPRTLPGTQTKAGRRGGDEQRSGRLLFAIVALAVALRLAAAFAARELAAYRPEGEITDGYHLIAENLHRGHGYRQFEVSPPTLQRLPGYPLFLAGIFALSGENYAVVQIAQAILGGLACWLLYRLGRWVASDRVGWIAAGLFAVYPTAVLTSIRLYSENLFFPLLLAFALVLARAARGGSRRLGILAGVLWGIGVLTRGVLILLPLALIPWLAWSREHRPLRRWGRWALPAVLAGVLTLAPWTVRNHRLAGAFVPVSTWGWAPWYHGIEVSRALLRGDDPGAANLEAQERRREAIRERLYGGETREYENARDYVRHESVARDLVLAELRADPTGAILRAVVGIPASWFVTYNRKFLLPSLLLHLPLMAAFVAGVLRMRRSDPGAFTRAWPVLGIIVYVNLVQAVCFPHFRYMAPAVALSFLFAAWLCWNLRRRPAREG